MIRIKHLFAIVAVIFFMWSCESIESIPDNPLDPNYPDYTAPTVQIISGPVAGETVTVPQVTFEWSGNELATSYRYYLTDLGWSEWGNSTSKTFDYLDEKIYQFSVQSAYDNGDTSAVSSIDFTVDAVKGPALMFYPRRQIAAVGDVVTIQILAEEVQDLAGIQLGINYDPSIVEIVSVSEGSIFTGKDNSIFHAEYNNSVGSLSVLMASLGGDEPSVGGTSDLLVMDVKVKAKSLTTFDYDGSEIFKDPQNNDISIVELVSGIIDAQ